MTHKSRGPEDYIPFRVVEESYFRSPRPPYASLAHAAGRTVVDTMIEGSLLDHRGRPLKTVPMALVSKHEPSAGRSYALEG